MSIPFSAAHRGTFLMPTYTTPPGEEDILRMAEAALSAMPASLAGRVAGVAMLIEDLADAALLAELGIDDPWALTGLYDGVPMPSRSVLDVAPLPDRITLYRLAILAEWVETGEDLSRLVGSVLIHEIAHHFGFSDAAIERIEADMQAP
jgi:predicted Zn-dependent protease with MMP-like domain